MKIVDIYKKIIALIFQSFKDSLFLLFLFSMYKMVDTMDIYKSLNTGIKTVMKNPKIIRFVSDHINTKKMWKHSVRKLPYILRDVSD